MIENNLRANKHIRYIHRDNESIDAFRSNPNIRISEEDDILMVFNNGYYGPVFLVLDYRNNHIFEYTDEIDNPEWQKMIIIKNLKHVKPLIEYLQQSIFTFNYLTNPASELEFRLTTSSHGVYIVRLDGPDHFVIFHRQGDGQIVSSDRFAFKDIPDVDAFDIELLKLVNFEYEICNDNKLGGIKFTKKGQNFGISYQNKHEIQYRLAEHAKDQVYQHTCHDSYYRLEFMLIFEYRRISDRNLKHWIRILQKCYLPEYSKTLLSNLEKNVPFLKWK